MVIFRVLRASYPREYWRFASGRHANFAKNESFWRLSCFARRLFMPLFSCVFYKKKKKLEFLHLLRPFSSFQRL